MLIVITDGKENASNKFNRAQIFNMIDHQRNKYSWQFVFLGANQDAIETGSTIGIDASSCLQFAPNKLGVEHLYRSASIALSGYRDGTAACLAFNENDRKAQEEAGVK